MIDSLVKKGDRSISSTPSCSLILFGGKDSAQGCVVTIFRQVEGVSSVPRLSIIVPYISDVAALETTLLSVLENRPQGCEVLVAHVGDYHDPYSLDHDEIRLIEAPADSQVVELVNAAASEACGAILHTLLPGCSVRNNWSAPALAWFQDASIGSVAPTMVPTDGKGTYAGLNPHCLPRRAWSQRIGRGEQAVATLCGGFYRRHVVTALNGWITSGHREGAEAEMALALQTLSLRGIAEPESQIEAPRSVIEGRTGGYALGNFAGKLSMAYSQIALSAPNSNSLASRLGHLAGGLISPTSVAERLGWVLGAKDRSLVSDIASRIERADALGANRQAKSSTEYRDTRRAA